MRKILSQFQECRPVWDKIYKVARRDKQFVQSKQWDEKVERERNKYGLATVTWPLIRHFFNRQLGNALPGSVDYKLTNIDANPNSKENTAADDAAVQVLNGHLRYIDKQSKSEIHRNKARKDQFSGGIGWLGVDYVTSDSLMDGEIQDMSPRYFDKIYAHPYYQKADASDMEYSFYFIDMNYEVAVGKFGNRIKRIKEKGESYHTFEDYHDCRQKISTLEDARHINHEYWMNDKDRSVRIAIHHWRRKAKRVYYIHDGEEYTADQWKTFKEESKEIGLEITGQKRVEKVQWMVEQRTICGWSVLEEKEFFIDCIPWTPVFGYSMEDGREYTYHGVVHDAANLQEHANWLASQHATKTSEQNTIALIDNGILGDTFKSVRKKGGIEFIGVDMSADLSGNGQPAQVINSPDDGSKELASLQFTIELLREITSTSSGADQGQVINSAQQLALSISDRDSVREELDINWRNAMECHTAKKIKMIKSVYDQEDLVKVVDLTDSVESIGSARISDSISTNYSVDITMSPSGTVQKQQAQQYAASLAASQDPVEARMGRIISLQNSDLKNKDILIKMIHKRSFAEGDFSNIPESILEEIVSEQEQSGQLQQTLQQLAEPIAQQQLEQLIQDKNVQAQIANADAVVAKSKADTERAGLQYEKANLDAQADIAMKEYDVIQEQEKARQDEAKSLSEFLQLQSEILEAEREGVQVNAQLAQQFLQLALQVQPQQIQ